MSESESQTFDAYSELQLAPGAEPELVKAAFKALAKKYHPDRFSDPIEKARAEKKMARLNEAQRQIQSGTYTPPSQEAPPQPSQNHSRPTSPKVSDPKPKPPKAHTKTSRKTISKAPFIWAAALFLIILVAPPIFSQSNLQNALEFEAKGENLNALYELNDAILQSPHNRELYRHRARLWTKLGEAEKAAVDLNNSKTNEKELKIPDHLIKTDQVPKTSNEN